MVMSEVSIREHCEMIRIAMLTTPGYNVSVKPHTPVNMKNE